eukprot:360904-Chlamydomonas_euryale.AAC.4
MPLAPLVFAPLNCPTLFPSTLCTTTCQMQASSPPSSPSLSGRVQGVRSLDIARSHGVRICFGSDLLGELHPHQAAEFDILARVLSPAEVLQSATLRCAQLFGKARLPVFGDFEGWMRRQGKGARGVGMLCGILRGG